MCRIFQHQQKRKQHVNWNKSGTNLLIYSKLKKFVDGFRLQEYWRMVKWVERYDFNEICYLNKVKVLTIKGKIELEIEVVLADVATGDPVGMGREDPHALPPPK